MISTLFANIVFRRILMAVTFTAVGYFGVTRFVSWAKTTLTNAANYDQKVLEVENLKKAHEAEIARRDTDSTKLEEEYAKFKKAARIEGGKYRELRESLQSVEDWNNIAVPEPVRRLLNIPSENEVHSADGGAKADTERSESSSSAENGNKRYW